MDITTPAEKSKEQNPIMEKLVYGIAPILLPEGTQVEKKGNGYTFYKKNNFPGPNGKKDEIHLANLLRNKKIKVADLSEIKVADPSEDWYGMCLDIKAGVVADAYIGKKREGEYIFIGEHVTSGNYDDERFRFLQRMSHALEDKIEKISKENSKTLYIGADIGNPDLVLYMIDIIDPRLSETEQDALLNKICNSLGL